MSDSGSILAGGEGADAFIALANAARPCIWNAVPHLAMVSSVLRAKLDDAEPADDFGFGHDPTAAWSIHSRLLLGIKRRVADETQRRAAARLFFLHEAMHVGIHTLTAPRSRDVGMLPRVLEQLDFEADVWALVHELARTTSDRCAAAVKLVDGILSTFWAFDDGSEPLRRLQVRRLNRYLIWAWQRICLARAGRDEDLAQILMAKPVLEVSGLPMRLEGHRVFVTLDQVDMTRLEIGLATASGFERYARGSVCPLEELVAGLRERNTDKILKCLRAVYDANQRGGSNAGQARG